MRTPRRGLLALAAMAGAVTTLLAPTAASAAYYGSETDYAEYRSSFPDDDMYYECREMAGVFGCFRSYGDIFFVRDKEVNGDPDGYAAVIEWNDADSNRSGACVNGLGTGKLGDCDKNFTEGHTIFWRLARYNNGNIVNRGAWVEDSA